MPDDEGRAVSSGSPGVDFPGLGVNRRQIRPPSLPPGVIPRPRLDDQFRQLLQNHEAVAVFAAPGSGKTVQAQLFAARAGWPYAWLTLDATHRSAGRFLVHVAAALSEVASRAPALVSEALAAGLAPLEVVVSLAEWLAPQPLLLVFDNCEAIVGAPEAAALLTTFLDYLPPQVRTLLLSRDEIDLAVGRMMLGGRLARITDRDLAADLEEARALLAVQGRPEHDPRPLLETTQGWIAGIAFDVRTDLRSSERPEFAAYLSREILGRLPEDEQQFLLETAILDVVTARGAVAIHGPGGHELWSRLSTRHLPATMTADRALVYHSCFRQFLREQLGLRQSSELADLNRRRARHLRDLGDHERAVGCLLEADDLDEAAAVAVDALPAIVDRADWGLVEQWLERFGPERVSASPVLLGARIRALNGLRLIDAAAALVRDLHRDGLLGGVAAADPGVMGHIGWIFQWRPREGLELLDLYPGDFRAAGVGYEMRAVTLADPVAPPHGRQWQDAERLVSWGLLVQGRLDELVDLRPPDDAWPPRSFFHTPYPLMVDIWRGRLDVARTRLEQVPLEARERTYSWVWLLIETWLLLAEGNAAEAVRTGREALAELSRRRSGWEPVFEVPLGRALAQLGQLDDARSLLANSVTLSTAAGQRAYVEWAKTFQGLALLRSGRPREARSALAEAVRGMLRAQRLLMLPYAGIYLAEAEWQLGNDDAARQAADAAYDASARMNAVFPLQSALEDCPAVLARRLRSEPPESRWRRLRALPDAEAAAATPAGRQRRVQGRVSSVEVQTFGPRTDLLINGAPAGVGRLKTIELAALLALNPAGMDRQALQEQLFPDSDQRRGGNYFRQVVHKLRSLVGVALDRDRDGRLRWPEEPALTASDVRFERLLGESNVATGENRLAKIQEALASFKGPYLVESDLGWVEDRRARLDALRDAASREAAVLALELGDYDRARTFAEMAIANDPYCEPAYRVLIRLEAELRNPAAALAVYQRARTALNELGVEPDTETLNLVRALRS